MISFGSHASGALGGPPSSVSLVRYGFAVYAVAAATLVQLGLQSVGLSHVVYILFYPAVAVAATLAGTRAGILATLLSAVAGRFLFLEPKNSFQIRNAEDIVGPNIRELENVIERMVILSKGRTLVSPPIELNEQGNFAQDKLTDMEREHIIRVLRETHGVLSGADGAATRLGISAPHSHPC